MDTSTKALSEITIFNKYAKYIPGVNRRESWHELVTRNIDMHIRKYPKLENEIRGAYASVYDKKVLPSMRSLQFGGRPIELANNRIYNCAFLPIDHIDAFSEIMFLLLGGTGVGFSVQKRHVCDLPWVQGPSKEYRKFLVGDSIEGWADAVKVLVEAYFLGKQKPIFDLRDIRKKGAALVTTGGKAPGPKPLEVCLNQLTEVLESAIGSNMPSLAVHDMCCIIADAVLAGGIRRAALISLFDRDDKDMLNCKSGKWYKKAPYRARANNSVLLLRGSVSKKEFYSLIRKIRDNDSGEPGIIWTNNLDWGVNPCGEVGLKPFQFCNLNEINGSDVVSQEDLNDRARASAFIATLQAGYTDLHYLRPIWRQTTEDEALIGVSVTGVGSGALDDLDLATAAKIVIAENKRVADVIGINPAARTTTIKPAGTSSLVIGSSSGIHAWHSKYYIRRMRLGKNEPLYRYLASAVPALIEDDEEKPKDAAIASFPQKAPEGAALRDESILTLLERVRRFNIEWIHPGHVSGDNMHNVSCTISVKPNDWDKLRLWMWQNRHDYSGIAILPYDGGTYVQAPFEECTKEVYEEMLTHLKEIDLSKVVEEDDNTHFSGEIACSGGLCDMAM